MIKKSVLIAIVAILLINISSASFKLGEPSSSIDSIQTAGDILKGWINLSFEEEPAKNLITSNLEGQISLLDFLNLNKLNFSCSPLDCKEGYSLTNSGDLEKTFSMSPGEEKIVSLYLDKNPDTSPQITYSFDVSASNEPSCLIPLEIYLFGNEVPSYKANNSFQEYTCAYDLGTGCFNSQETYGPIETAGVGKNLYCEKIRIPESPEIKVGAWLKKGDSKDLKMSVYYANSTNIFESCTIPGASLSEEGEGYCLIKKSVPQPTDFYVCISAAEDTSHEIVLERTNTCGFTSQKGLTNKIEGYDFYIFARGAKFDNVGTLTIDNTKASLTAYISSRYKNNCTNGCIIPIKFYARTNVNVAITNAKMNYNVENLRNTDIARKIYSTETNPVKVTSNFSRLDLSKANFIIPSANNLTVKLFLGNDSKNILAEKDLQISSSSSIIPDIFPTITYGQYNTEFSVLFNTSNGTKFIWNFGDGSSITTENNYIYHKYPEIKNYSLTLEIQKNNVKLGSRTFLVTVLSPKDIINLTINEDKKDLNAINVQISSLPYAQNFKNLVISSLKLNDSSDTLNAMASSYRSAKTEKDYLSIMGNISSIRIPSSIQMYEFPSITYLVDSEKIDPSLFTGLGEEITEEDYEGYKESIAKWDYNNVDIKIKLGYLIASYPETQETFLTYGDLSITPKNDIEKTYLIIGHSDTVTDIPEAKELQNAIAITFPELTSEQNVKFAAPEGIQLSEIKVYLSPEISKLELPVGELGCNNDGVCDSERGEDYENCSSDCQNPIKKAIILSIIVLLLAIPAYLLLHWWYITRYETHLFKQRSNLFNIISFINSALSRNLSVGEIKSKLKQSGWNNEQIAYAIKKVQGRKIMPFEFRKKSEVKTSPVQVKNYSESQIKVESNIKKRNPALVLIFWILSLGLFGIYWYFATTKELSKMKSAPSIKLIWLIILFLFSAGLVGILLFLTLNAQSVPNTALIILIAALGVASSIVYLIFLWKHSKSIGQLTGFNNILLFVLWILFSPAAIIISQIELNKKA